MKKLPLFAWLAWSCLPVSAQITVSANTFPAPGDILRYVEAANPNVAVTLYTPPGGNQFWDLSGLTAGKDIETYYLLSSSGYKKDAFPEARIVVLSVSGEYYYGASSTKFELFGHATNSVGGLPLEAIYKNQPPLVERHAPLNFFDIYQQSSSNLLKWAYSEIPAGTFSLPATPDSVRFRISKQVVEAVDAWGTLRLPGALPQSEFPVLRLKKTTYREQRMDAKIPRLGWLDVTDNVVRSGSTWAPLFGVDTITTHHYFNDVSKEEIAVLTFNNAQNAVVSVVYKNTSAVTPVVETESAALPRLQIHPNPATFGITIRCANTPPGMYNLKIFNSLGAVVLENSHFLTETTPFNLVLPGSLNGLYFCRLEDAKGDMVGASRLIVGH